MSETLSQKEIDGLLQGATSVTAPVVDDVVPYNFVRPPRVSKDRRATIESVYNHFALSFQALLSSRLRVPMDVVVASVEQVSFSEFLQSIGSPCAAFVFRMEERVGAHGVLDFGSDVAFSLLDRLFGGPGEPGAVRRSLTPLEQTVVRSVAERVLALLREAWQELLPMSPEVVAFESNPDMLQIADREDNVVVANLEVRSAGGNGFVTVCLPMSSLESFLQDRPVTRSPVRERRGDLAATRPLVAACLQHARTTVSARLPQVWLKARDIVGLAPGQVLQTDQALDGAIEVHVNGRLRFQASLGQVRRRVGLRIVQTVSAPEPQRPGRSREGRIS